MLKLDHIAIACEDLAAGRAQLETVLGVPLEPGGRHERFGTHNLLLGLWGGLYLELIAIDPAASAPDGPRWFDLDAFRGETRPVAWICAAPSLDAAIANFPVDPGRPNALSRGDLRWRMAVPEDGRLPFDTLFPALIEWQDGAHPASHLPDRGCAMDQLIVRHPQAQALAEMLSDHLDDDRVTFDQGAPALSVTIATPRGACRLG